MNPFKWDKPAVSKVTKREFHSRKQNYRVTNALPIQWSDYV